MAQTIIVINRHLVAQNRRSGLAGRTELLNVISVRSGKHGGSNYPGNRVRVDGPCFVVYDPNHPLPCGATCWIETIDDEVAPGDHWAMTDDEKADQAYYSKIAG